MSMNPFGSFGANPAQPSPPFNPAGVPPASPQPGQGYDASSVPFSAAQQRDRDEFFAGGPAAGVPPEAYQTPTIPGANPNVPQAQVGQLGIDRLIPVVSEPQTRVYQAMLGMTVPGPLPDPLVDTHGRFKRFHDKVGPATALFAPVASATIMLLAKIRMEIAELQQAAQTLAKMLASASVGVQPQAPVGLKKEAPAPSPAPVAPTPPGPPLPAPPPTPPPSSSPPAPEVTTTVAVDANAPPLGSLCLADGKVVIPGEVVEVKWRKAPWRLAEFIKVDEDDPKKAIVDLMGKKERIPWQDKIRKRGTTGAT